MAGNKWAVDGWVSLAFIHGRARKMAEKGYSPPKYLKFCQWAISIGLQVWLHDAVTTVSKYVYLYTDRDRKKLFKVRFSDHQASHWKERNKDADFYVGKTQHGYISTEAAQAAVLKWMAKIHEEPIELQFHDVIGELEDIIRKTKEKDNAGNRLQDPVDLPRRGTLAQAQNGYPGSGQG